MKMMKIFQKRKKDEYTGYKEVYLKDEQIAQFYENPKINNFNLLTNQYLIIYNENKEYVDAACWTGDRFRRLSYKVFSSRLFGEIKPLKGDAYQSLLVDSMLNNQMTLIKGPAGSGKTNLSLAYLFYLLEHNKIDKIIIFCNTVATKGSAKLGFYPGTRDQKLLDSQIGNLLSCKVGSKLVVEQLIADEQLIILPMSDIRGYDTSGMRAGVYISEAQNLDISLMKLALQRIGEDSICLIDGDCRTQVDNEAFAGRRSGMRRVSQVFKGQEFYGEVELKYIHRSKIGKIAEQM